MSSDPNSSQPSARQTPLSTDRKVDLHRAEGPAHVPIREIDGESASGGIVTFRNGRQFWTPIACQDDDGDYHVRVESGWYGGYTRDGYTCALRNGRWVRESEEPNPFDIVAFERDDGKLALERGVTTSNPYVSPFP